MNPTRKEALFAAALERPPAERAIFLDGACLGDAALRAHVEARLAAHEQPATLLVTQAEAAHQAPTIKLDFAEEPPNEAVGQTLGRYKLLEKIGEGGFGEVWMAEQREPVKRRVALKIIKLGMDSRQIVARFEAERQALALMDHPNIAKVFDAGTTDSGRPYFVMELVRGIPITDFCDQHQLTVNERLELFVTVCQAKRPKLNFLFKRSHRAFKEVMAYFHIDRLQRYLQELGFNNILNWPIQVDIDGETEDNSYFSPLTGSLTFGTGGVDDAEDAEIILHEYGHAIQDAIVPGFGRSAEARADI